MPGRIALLLNILKLLICFKTFLFYARTANYVAGTPEMNAYNYKLLSFVWFLSYTLPSTYQLLK